MIVQFCINFNSRFFFNLKIKQSVSVILFGFRLLTLQIKHKANLGITMIFRILIISFTFMLGLAAKVEQPNFIFIMTDDQGYGDLGCYGHPSIKTPNIDKMADRGVLFTDFYARHKCSPARASLMSGAFNFRVGVGSIVYPNSTTGLIKEVVTIPEMLKNKGYTSALIGKWHLGHTAGYLPRDQGFSAHKTELIKTDNNNK